MGAERDIGMAIAMLVEAYHVSMDSMTPARIKVYERALQKVPLPLLRPMVDRCLETRRPYGKDWLPAVQQLLEDAEECRKLVLARHPYTACDSCMKVGWVSVKRDGFQKPTYARCPCWERHQAFLAGLGGSPEPLALPPAREPMEVGE